MKGLIVFIVSFLISQAYCVCTVKDIDVGNGNVCAILDDFSIKCWGDNTYGQLGQGDYVDVMDPTSISPVDIGTSRTAGDICTGFCHVCVLLDTNEVKCWGCNNAGQLGYGDFTTRNQPESINVVDLGVGRTATEISCGRFHTCALLDDSTVKCWGNNDYGQVGKVASLGGVSTPEQIIYSGTPISIDAGDFKTCMILNDNTVKCWGYNHPNPDTILDVGTGLTVQAVSGGFNHTCLILNDNTVKCWGQNDNFNKLGYSSVTELQVVDTNTIVDLNGDTAKLIAAGYGQTCIILNDDSLRCFGRNYYGESGYSHTNDNDSSKVTLGTTPTKLSCDVFFCCVLFIDETVKCWGRNKYGQLGYSDTVDKLLPSVSSITVC